VIIDAYRDVLLYGSRPALAPFVCVAAAAFVLLPAVWLTFHRMEFSFAERI